MNSAINDAVELWLNDNTHNPGTQLTENLMFWCDCETTGLDSGTGMLIELGFVVTDSNGTVVPNGVFQSVIWNSPIVKWKEDVSPFVAEMHERSGLVEELQVGYERSVIREGSIAPIEDVEDRAIKFLTGHLDKALNMEPATSPSIVLAGSSVGFDRNWITAKMPGLANMLSHRIIDVSSLMEIARVTGRTIMWDDDDAWRPLSAHRVLPDLIDSIESYRYYMNSFKAQG